MSRATRYRSGMAWALGVGLVMALLSVRGVFSGLEWRAYDMQFAARAGKQPQHDIIIVIIDDGCLDRLGPWPWPMARHAQLVRRLAASEPKAIVFDILFFGTSDAESAPFAHELRRAGNVFLASCFLQGERYRRGGVYGLRMTKLRAPPRSIRTAAAGVGAVNIFPERDGVVRAAPLVIASNPHSVLSLSMEVAKSLRPRSSVRVAPGAAGERVRLGKMLIPTDGAGEMLISYDGGYRAFPWETYSDVLAGKVPAERFRNRVVFVGFSATGLSDTRPTPLSPACPGVEINAHILRTIMNGDFIRPLGATGNALVILGLAVLLGPMLVRLRPLAALVGGALAAAIVVGVGIYLVHAAGIWMNLVTPGLAVLLMGVTVAAAGYRVSDRDNLRLETSLDALALATRMIAAGTSRRPVIEAIREEMRQLAAARSTDLYLLDEEMQELLVEGDPEVRIPLTGHLGAVAREGVALLLDASADRELARELDRGVDFVPGPVAFIPLRRQERVVGVAQVVRAAFAEPFGERELELLNALSQEAAVALENVELYEKLEGKVELANREMVRAYSQLALEKDRVDALLENMADGVIMTSIDERVMYVNPAAEQMFKVTSAQAAGRPLAECFDLAGLSEVIAAARQLPGRMAIETLRTPEPRLVLTANAAVIGDERGEPVGVVTVLSDVTLLQELSDMKTEFVSLVSHELRTPLTSIQGFAQTLRADQEGHFDAATRGEFLEIIESECHRLLAMINELLDASRIEAGRALSMNWSEVELRPIVERVVTMHASAAPLHQFEIAFAPDFPVIEADADRMQQVITNIISNAVKYAPDGGPVRITGTLSGDEVVVAVEDHGLGMTEAQLGQLFQRYHRVESDASKRIRGTGLGLYLTKGLVEAQGGRIWATSAGPGRGSKFSFALPVKRVKERPGAGASPAGGG